MYEEFAADFETSSLKVFTDEDNLKLPIPAYKVENKKIVPTIYLKKTIDKEKSKTWVYHAGLKSFENEKFYEFYSIEEFMKFIENYKKDMKINFHNAKFDTSFIIQYLVNNNFKQILNEDNRFLNQNINPEEMNSFIFSNQTIFSKYLKQEGYIDKEEISKDTINFFETSVNGMGILYSVKIYYLKEDEPLHIVDIYDSLKILNFSIRFLGEKFLNQSNMEKEELDYSKIRLPNRPDLLEEQDHIYLERDVDILKQSLLTMKASEYIYGDKDKTTIASLALDDFKEMWYQQCTNNKNGKPKQKEKFFRAIFPVISDLIDNFVRKSYKGGFCYVYPFFKNVEIEKSDMCVLDVNSLFPYIMLSKPIPYGFPVYSSKDKIEIPEKDGEIYDYYFTKVRVKFELKENHIPSIMIKGTDLKSEYNLEEGIKCNLNEYLQNSNSYYIELILTKDDYELMHQQYNCEEFIVETYYFKTLSGVFENYINKWGEVKVKASQSGDKASRQIAKIFLNSLYGKFGAKVINHFKFFKLQNGFLKSYPQISQISQPIYVPVASAITAGARRKTIETAQRIMNYGLKKYNEYTYCYSDTDSIHTTLNKQDLIECLGDEIDINKTGELGLWDIEHDDIIKSKFIRTKTYLEETKNHEFTGGCAGLPKDMQKYLTFDVFKSGAIFVGKLLPVEVQGGTMLVEEAFTIKQEKTKGVK